MATLFITEYAALAATERGIRTEHGMEDGAVTRQTVTFTTTTASAAFQSGTKFIRVLSDAAACLEFGGTPTATTSDHAIAAEIEYFFGVCPGDKVAAVTR